MSGSVLSIGETEALLTAIFERAGAAHANAASAAQALTMAEADGLVGHGLSRVPSYVAQLKVGKIDGRATPVATQAAPAVLRIDARHGFAYPAIDLAIEHLTTLAPRTGIAAAAIHGSHHSGAMGWHVERLARQGLVGFMVANTPAAMMPWGGNQRVLGTNPIAFACPIANGDPIVIDLAMSKVARGLVQAAAQRGEAIPADWAVDINGQATTDPKAALAGAMLPLGDAKGAALALMVEILAAGLTGATFAGQASSFLDTDGGPPGTGQFLMALAPIVTGGPQALSHVETLAASITSQPGVRLPGERRQALRRKAQAEGIAVSAATLKLLQDLLPST